MERSTRGGLAHLAMGPKDGPIVVCLHGFPDSPLAWQPAMREIARAGYRVLAPYMPGYGPSAAGAPFDIDAVADRLACFARAHGARVDFVGHDWGAAVVHWLCHRHAEGIRAAVTLSVPHPSTFLLNTALQPAQWVRSAYMLAFQVPGLAEAVLARDSPLVRRALLALWATWSPGFRPDPTYLDSVIDAIGDAREPLAYYRAMFRPFGAFARRLATVRPSAIPMLYLHGRDDGCIAPAIADGQQRYYPQGYREVVVADAGHFLPCEAPVRCASEIVAFLDR